MIAVVQAFSSAHHPNAQIVHLVDSPGLERRIGVFCFLHQDIMFDLAPSIGDFLLNKYFRKWVLHGLPPLAGVLANYQVRTYEQL